ncbi:hypothetical protein B0H14DRAFT_2594270 [Mycena olivaceomarginata]|nr:hypothetical protein B0H14DRAFT_2594270 [Mycena olivaceomarginata]
MYRVEGERDVRRLAFNLSLCEPLLSPEAKPVALKSQAKPSQTVGFRWAWACLEVSEAKAQGLRPSFKYTRMGFATSVYQYMPSQAPSGSFGFGLRNVKPKPTQARVCKPSQARNITMRSDIAGSEVIWTQLAVLPAYSGTVTPSGLHSSSFLSLQLPLPPLCPPVSPFQD